MTGHGAQQTRPTWRCAANTRTGQSACLWEGGNTLHRVGVGRGGEFCSPACKAMAPGPAISSVQAVTLPRTVALDIGVCRATAQCAGDCRTVTHLAPVDQLPRVPRAQADHQCSVNIAKDLPPHQGNATWEIGENVPLATYFVRAYGMCGKTMCAYGNSTGFFQVRRPTLPYPGRVWTCLHCPRLLTLVDAQRCLRSPMHSAAVLEQKVRV